MARRSPGRTHAEGSRSTLKGPPGFDLVRWGDANAAAARTGSAVSRARWVGLVVSLLLVVTAVGVTLTLGDALSAGARGHSASNTHPPPGQPAGSGFSQWLDEGSVRTRSGAQWAAIARHNAIVVLNSWDYRLIPILKAANPAVRVYVYKDLSGVRSDDCTTANGTCTSCPPGVADSALISSGMGYCWVRHHHPQWLLRAAGAGHPLEFRGYPGIWETDYGNRAYMRQWLRNVIADVRSHGWDGVEVDNALTSANTYGVASKYPTDQAVQAATYAALRYLGPGLRIHGVGAVFNVGYATRFPGLWQRWLGPVGGLMQEFYLSSSAQAGAAGNLWRAFESEVSSCVAQRKSCWFHTGDYATAVTPATREYALASYLLAADGHQYLAIGSPAAPAVSQCRALGAPLGPAVPVGTLLVRSFGGGFVVVNPSAEAASIGASHRRYFVGHRPMASVKLPPKTGAILGLTTAAACS